MNKLRILYHMARADFLERARRYSFLIMLGMVVWLGYNTATGKLVMRVPPNYVGEINSAWVGGLMTVTAGIILVLFGFYLVKGSVSRDYDTSVGQIIATTPLSRPLYLLGKWLSNFAVLGAMILILLLAGIAMNLLVGKAPLELWALASPLLLIGLPCMAVVAAIAVLFETLGWLRGGFGNVVYFFVFMVLIIPAIFVEPYRPLLDFTGVRLISDDILRAATLAYPGIEGGFEFQMLSSTSAPEWFHYTGIDWAPYLVLTRLFFVLTAIGLTFLSSLFFDRFNTSRSSTGRSKQSKSSDSRSDIPDTRPMSPVTLTPLHNPLRFRFGALYLNELKMLLKRHRWWWYVVSVGLVIAQIAASPDDRPAMLAASWLWLILLLSGLGVREAKYATREIVFSAPRPAFNQLPALWLATVTVVGLMGSGAFLRYLLGGEPARLLAWFGGVLFIPSLALAVGVLTSSRKVFEVIYVIWMYIILNDALSVGNELPPLDFVGVVPHNPWLIYCLLAIGLLAFSVFIRQQQLSGGIRRWRRRNHTTTTG